MDVVLTPSTDELDVTEARILARKIVLRRLDVAPRTRGELSDSLVAQQIPALVITEVLDRFEEVGLIDDELFARMWAQSRHTHKGQSRHVIRQELRRKGIDDDLIATALDAISDDQETERARALVERKLVSLTRFDNHVIERRLVGMLARKGYPTSLCFTVVRESLATYAIEQSEEFAVAQRDQG
ncbi:MAG: recombination regulator RecX [Candidatus Nanopelagicales bacterium]|nr:recombination regulator RecX [Candidatus Nanopelagicales bacterium]